MPELTQPITGSLGIEAATKPQEDTTSFDLGAGGHYKILSSVTEEGSGYQFGGNLYQSPNTRDIYGFGFQLSLDKNKGGDFYKDQAHSTYTLTLSRGQKETLGRDEKGREILTGIASKNLYTGFEKTGEDTSIELGSDIFSYSFLWRTSGRFALALHPYLGMLFAIPFDSQSAEEISLSTLRVGVDLRLMMTDWTSKPPQEGINNYDMVYYMISGFHRLARNYATAKTLSGPSQEVQDYTNQLFGEGGGTPSDRLKDLSLFAILGMRGAGGEDGDELSMQLNASSEQKGWMVVSKLIWSAAEFGLSQKDSSLTLMTQGAAGGLELVDWTTGEGLGLDLQSRRALTNKAQQEKARDFVLYRALLSALTFLAGASLKDSKEGPVLLQAGEQNMIATTTAPDPAKTGAAEGSSHHLVYEWVKDGGRYLGYKETTYLPSSNLYTDVRLLTQALPGPAPIQEELDQATNRNPLQEGAKALVSAGLGFETHTGPISWSAGLRTTLAYGQGPKPVPGIGAEQQMLFTFGDKTRFEFGLGVGEDYLQGRLILGLSPVVGFRTSLP